MKILFIHQKLMSFVKKDMDILSSKHELREIQFPHHSSIGALIMSIIKIFSGVLWCDITFSWFGKLNAFFPILFSKLFGKKSVVVAGNDDVFKFVYKGKRYGILNHPIKKWFSYFAFKNADQILAVSKTSLEEAIINAKANPKRTKMIYHGFDSNKWKKLPSINKEKLVVTIGRVTHETFIQKGLKIFVESAKYFEDTKFILIGPFIDDSISVLKDIATPNVVFTDWIEDEELIKILSRAFVYVQASLHEAFGCSIAEAMLCECIPVVANRSAMPEVVGDAGYYHDDLTVESLKEGIELALLDNQMGAKSRKRIIKEFPYEKRSIEILNAVENIIP